MTYLLVDTETGLKIVQATQRNFFNSRYAVQLVGTKDECVAERRRLQAA